MGNLTRDPEVKTVNGGTAVANLRLAINRWGNSQSNKKEVCYISVVAWDKQALACEEFLKRGSTIVVEGRLSSRQWVGPDGMRRNVIEIIANLINFMGKEEEIPASISMQNEDALKEDQETVESI